MNACLHASLCIGLDGCLDLFEGLAGGTPHSFEYSFSLNGRLINTSEPVAHIVRCTQYPTHLLSRMQGGDLSREPQSLD